MPILRFASSAVTSTLARYATLGVVASTFLLTGCASDEEKVMRMQEEINAIVLRDKDDCTKMAADIKSLGESKGKSFQKAHRALKEKSGDKVNALLTEKFPDRMKSGKEAMMAGMKCLMTEEVATAMMTVEGDGEDQPDRKPPEKPFTGAPVAFVVEKVEAKALAVSAYNFGDKTFASYQMLIRYYGADGKALKTSMFNRDYASWSISGKSYRIPAKQWRSFRLESLQVPEGAVKADILVSSVTATVNGGLKMESEPTWKMPAALGFEWPAPTAAK